MFTNFEETYPYQSECKGQEKSRFVFFIFTLLWFFCIVQTPEFNRDRENYIGLLIYAQKGGIEHAILILEPFFAVLSSVLSMWLNDSAYYVSFFAITALCSLVVKLNLLNRLGYSTTIYITLFLSYFYFLHEVTQVRIGLGIGFLYLSLYNFISSQKIKFFIFGFLSVLCHYSCFVFILFPLLLSRAESFVFWLRMWFLIILMLVVFLSHGILFSLLDLLASAADLKKISDNLILLQELDIDKYAALVRLVPHIPFLVFGGFYFNVIKNDKYLFVFWQCYILFFIVVITFSELYVVAFRLGDLFMFSYVLLFSGLYAKVKNKFIYASFIFLFSSVMALNVIKSVFIF